MKEAWDAVNGLKTYGILAIGFGMVVLEGVFGVDVPGVQVSPEGWMNDLIAILAAAAMRHGMGK